MRTIRKRLARRGFFTTRRYSWVRDHQTPSPASHHTSPRITFVSGNNKPTNQRITNTPSNQINQSTSSLSLTHLIIAALEGYHKALGQGRQLCHSVHYPGAHVPRVARHKAHALDARHIRHVAQEIGEGLSRDHVSPVRIHVLAQQSYLCPRFPGFQ